MGWLIGYTIASLVGAFFVVRLFEYALAGVAGGLAGVAKASLFVSVWTAITTGTGMRAFSKTVRGLRQGNKEVSKRLYHPPKDNLIK